MRPVENGFLQALLGSATRLTTDTLQPGGMRAAHTLFLKVLHTVWAEQKSKRTQIKVEMSLASQKTDKITDVAH